jgi:hypothetical protein
MTRSIASLRISLLGRSSGSCLYTSEHSNWRHFHSGSFASVRVCLLSGRFGHVFLRRGSDVGGTACIAPRNRSATPQGNDRHEIQYHPVKLHSRWSEARQSLKASAPIDPTDRTDRRRRPTLLRSGQCTNFQVTHRSDEALEPQNAKPTGRGRREPVKCIYNRGPDTRHQCPDSFRTRACSS